MLNLIIGFILGYYVHANKESLKEYWDKFIVWLREGNEQNNEQ